MGVRSDGSYGIEEGVVFGFPVTIDKEQRYSIVKDLPIDDFVRSKLDASCRMVVERHRKADQRFEVSTEWDIPPIPSTCELQNRPSFKLE